MLRIARIALTLLAMACSSRGPAPPEPPAPRPVAVADAAVDAADTELARLKLDGWLAVFNGGKRDEILAFRERELSDRGFGLRGSSRRREAGVRPTSRSGEISVDWRIPP